MKARVAMWACLAAAVMLATAAVIAPAPVSADDIDVGRPVSYDGIASATGVHATFDRTEGLTVISQPVYVNLADGSSTFSASETPYGRASIIYPGRAVTKGAGLVCGQIPAAAGPLRDAVCNFDYPLTVEAGNQPDVSVAASQELGGPAFPLGLNAVSARAHADHAYVSTDADIASLDATGVSVTPAAALAFRRQAAQILHGSAAAAGVTAAASDNVAVHVDSVSAHTHHGFDDKDKGLFIVTADTDLSGVSLLGGTIHIDGIHVSSSYRTDGRQVRDHKDHVDIAGVTVAGQAATINEQGITVAGAGQGKPALDALNSALQAALKATGSTVHVLQPAPNPPYGTDQPCSEGTATGVQFYSQQDLSAIPNVGGTYYAEFMLGQACTVALASGDRNTAESLTGAGIELGGASAGTETGGASPDVGGSGTALTDNGASLSAGGPVVPSSRTRRATGGSRVGSKPTQQQLGFLERSLRGRLVSDRFDLLYAAFTLAFIALCIGGRILSVGASRTVRSSDQHGN